MKYLKSNAVKNHFRQRDRQIGKDALAVLDRKIEEYLDKLCRQFNGHKKRISAEMIHYFDMEKTS